MTDKTIPRATISLFSFNRMPNTIKFTIDPKVINFPNDPCAFKMATPSLNSKVVNKYK